VVRLQCGTVGELQCGTVVRLQCGTVEKLESSSEYEKTLPLYWQRNLEIRCNPFTPNREF